MKYALLLAMALPLCASAAESEGRFPLVTNNRPAAVFEVPTGDQTVLRPAIRRFNAVLQQVCGTVLPEREQAASGGKIRFELRKNDSALTADHFQLSFSDPDTLLIRCTAISAVWALNHLLRQFAGVEWLLPETCGLSFQPRKDLTVPRKTVEVKKGSFSVGRRNSVRTVWADNNMTPGVRIDHDLTRHAFPASLYGRNTSWPKVILPMLNGKKITAPPDPKDPRRYWQPCYSHPETAKIAAKNLLEYLKKHPDTPGISLGSNDNGGYCECPECLKMDGERRSDHSESYFTFINRVLEEVCREYPKLTVTVFAYGSTFKPPGFPLHPNALAVLTIDIGSCVSPEIMAGHLRVIDAWSRKAALLGIWDYSWGRPYFVPRMYNSQHARMLKHLHRRGARLYYGENCCGDGLEGPKHYLISKLIWDIDLDPVKLENEWYERCVGKKAAPFLAGYYRVWNDYFAGPARETPWFRSASSVYMTFNDSSHIYGIREEDIRQADRCMEQTVALAGEPREKERAVRLSNLWRQSRLLLRIHGAGIYDSSGRIHTAEQALRLLDEVGHYPERMKEFQSVSEWLARDRNLRPYYQSKAYLRGGYSLLHRDFPNVVTGHLLAASDFAGDPRVAAALRRLGQDVRLPSTATGFCRHLAHPESRRNLLRNGDAESGVPADFSIHPAMTGRAALSVSNRYHAGGKQAFRIDGTGHEVLFWVRASAEPDTAYLVTFKVFLPKPSAEGYLEAALYSEKSGRNQQWRNLAPLKLSGGVWQTFSVMTTTRPTGDSVRLRLHLRKFERGETVYFDDLQLFKL